MKKLLPFLIILLLVAGCKKKENDPVPNIGDETLGIKAFSVPGVPAENITIKDKDQLVVIKLPANYNGDFMKPVIVANDGFTVSGPVNDGFNFQGNDVEFLVENVKHDGKLYKVVVLSDDPIKILDAPKSYERSIEPESSILIPIPIMLPGTASTVDQSGKISNFPTVKIRNKADGSLLENFWVDKSRDSTGKQFVTLYLSPLMDAGEFEASIQWGDKNVTVTSPIVIKYGKMLIYNGFGPASQTDAQLNMGGYNIYPGNTYEALLENDFIESKRIPLIRKDYRNLTAAVPKDLPTGSYKVTVLVNGKTMPNGLHGMGVYAGFFFKKTADEPFIYIVSQPSKKVTSPGMYSYYENTNIVSRNEDLLVHFAWPEQPRDSDLELVNRATKEKFTLQNPGISNVVGEGEQLFSAYKIPAELPNGQYEAYVVSGPGRIADQCEISADFDNSLILILLAPS